MGHPAAIERHQKCRRITKQTCKIRIYTLLLLFIANFFLADGAIPVRVGVLTGSSQTQSARNAAILNSIDVALSSTAADTLRANGFEIQLTHVFTVSAGCDADSTFTIIQSHLNPQLRLQTPEPFAVGARVTASNNTDARPAIQVLIDCTCSGSSIAIHPLLVSADILHVGVLLTSVLLSSVHTFPNFIRITPSDSEQLDVMLELIQTYWPQSTVAILASNSTYGQTAKSRLTTSIAQRLPSVNVALPPRPWSPGASQNETRSLIDYFVSQRVRIFIIFGIDADTRTALSVCNDAGATGSGYAFLISSDALTRDTFNSLGAQQAGVGVLGLQSQFDTPSPLGQVSPYQTFLQSYAAKSAARGGLDPWLNSSIPTDATLVGPYTYDALVTVMRAVPLNCRPSSSNSNSSFCSGSALAAIIRSNGDTSSVNINSSIVSNTSSLGMSWLGATGVVAFESTSNDRRSSLFELINVVGATFRRVADVINAVIMPTASIIWPGYKSTPPTARRFLIAHAFSNSLLNPGYARAHAVARWKVELLNAANALGGGDVIQLVSLPDDCTADSGRPTRTALEQSPFVLVLAGSCSAPTIAYAPVSPDTITQIQAQTISAVDSTSATSTDTSSSQPFAAPIVSYLANSGTLDDRSQFDTFFRLMPAHRDACVSLIPMAQHFGWRKMGFLFHSANPLIPDCLSGMHELAAANRITLYEETFNEAQMVPDYTRGVTNASILAGLNRLRVDRGVNVIILHGVEWQLELFAGLRTSGLLNQRGIALFIVRESALNIGATNITVTESYNLGYTLFPTYAGSADGHAADLFRAFSADYALAAQNAPVSSPIGFPDGDPGAFGSFAADAVDLIGRAIIAAKKVNSLDTTNSPLTSLQLLSVLRNSQVRLDGVSGQIVPGATSHVGVNAHVQISMAVRQNASLTAILRSAVAAVSVDSSVQFSFVLQPNISVSSLIWPGGVEQYGVAPPTACLGGTEPTLIASTSLYAQCWPCNTGSMLVNGRCSACINSTVCPFASPNGAMDMMLPYIEPANDQSVSDGSIDPLLARAAVVTTSPIAAFSSVFPIAGGFLSNDQSLELILQFIVAGVSATALILLLFGVDHLGCGGRAGTKVRRFDLLSYMHWSPLDDDSHSGANVLSRRKTKLGGTLTVIFVVNTIMLALFLGFRYSRARYVLQQVENKSLASFHPSEADITLSVIMRGMDESSQCAYSCRKGYHTANVIRPADESFQCVFDSVSETCTVNTRFSSTTQRAILSHTTKLQATPLQLSYSFPLVHVRSISWSISSSLAERSYVSQGYMSAAQGEVLYGFGSSDILHTLQPVDMGVAPDRDADMAYVAYFSRQNMGNIVSANNSDLYFDGTASATTDSFLITNTSQSAASTTTTITQPGVYLIWSLIPAVSVSRYSYQINMTPIDIVTSMMALSSSMFSAVIIILRVIEACQNDQAKAIHKHKERQARRNREANSEPVSESRHESYRQDNSYLAPPHRGFGNKTGPALGRLDVDVIDTASPQPSQSEEDVNFRVAVIPDTSNGSATNTPLPSHVLEQFPPSNATLAVPMTHSPLQPIPQRLTNRANFHYDTGDSTPVSSDGGGGSSLAVSRSPSPSPWLDNSGGISFRSSLGEPHSRPRSPMVVQFHPHARRARTLQRRNLNPVISNELVQPEAVIGSHVSGVEEPASAHL